MDQKILKISKVPKLDVSRRIKFFVLARDLFARVSRCCCSDVFFFRTGLVSIRMVNARILCPRLGFEIEKFASIEKLYAYI